MLDQRFKPNPYDVLEVSPAASNQEIIQAFTRAMKQRKYTPDQIAKAKKILINKEERIIADYLRPYIPLVKKFKVFNLPQYNLDSNWEILPEYDSLPQNITESIANAYRDEFN